MSKGGLQVYGMGNAIMDLQLNISEDAFAQLGLEKSSMNLVDVEQQTRLLEQFRNENIHRASGGSAANTIIALTQLGAASAYSCIVGDDQFGQAYIKEMSEIGVKTHNSEIAGGVTGTSVILITPDAERTMNTHLGISAELSSSHVDEEILSSAEWLYIEGYLFSSPSAVEAVNHAVALAKKHGVKVAVTCSDAFIVEVFREPLTEVLKQSDLVFANYREATAFTGEEDQDLAFAALAEIVPVVAVTMSEKGAFVGSKESKHYIEAQQVPLVDATGAGDMFAGGFLYGLTNGLSVEESGKLACFLGSTVVSQMGPRLEGNVRELAQQQGILQ